MWVWREGWRENKGVRGRSGPGGGLVVSFSIIVFGSLVRGGIFAGVGFPFKEVLARLAALRTNGRSWSQRRSSEADWPTRDQYNRNSIDGD